jgi:hypothetical protein
MSGLVDHRSGDQKPAHDRPRRLVARQSGFWIVADRGACRALLLIGQSVVASTAVGRGPLLLALDGGPDKDQPLPTVVRCRERRQDVATI